MRAAIAVTFDDIEAIVLDLDGYPPACLLPRSGSRCADSKILLAVNGVVFVLYAFLLWDAAGPPIRNATRA